MFMLPWEEWLDKNYLQCKMHMVNEIIFNFVETKYSNDILFDL